MKQLIAIFAAVLTVAALAVPTVVYSQDTVQKPVPAATPVVPLGPGALKPIKLAPAPQVGPRVWSVPYSTFGSITAICDRNTGNLIYRDVSSEGAIALAVVPNGCKQ